METIDTATAAGHFALRALAADLKADLRDMRRQGIDPATFLGGVHERYIEAVVEAIKAGREFGKL